MENYINSEMYNKIASYSDSRLVEMLKGNKSDSEAAFTELYNRYSRTVHAYCMRVFNNETQAEDIFQETFIRFYENVKSSYKAPNVGGYLITIARNLCLNYKRDKKQTVQIDGMDFESEANQNFENKELLELITMALDLLEFEYREAFVLREYDGLSYNEIADITGSTITNSKSRVFRAKQKIKDILAPYLKDLYKEQQ